MQNGTIIHLNLKNKPYIYYIYCIIRKKELYEFTNT